MPGVTLNFDLAELRGYHYHTGMVFAAYQTGTSEAIAMGGRYDDIGEEFVMVNRRPVLASIEKFSCA